MGSFLPADITLILTIGLVGGIFSREELTWGPFMFGRPIVLAPFLGWLLGDITIGFSIGVLLEFLSAHYLPIGSTVPPDFSLAAILATSSCLLAFQGPQQVQFMPGALLLSLIIALVAMRAEIYIRQINIGLAHRADVLVRKHLFRQAYNLNLLGLGFFFLRGFLLTTFFLILSLFILRGLAQVLPSMLLLGTSTFRPLLMALGVAVVVELSAERYALWIFGLSLGVILLVLRQNWFSLAWLLSIFFIAATLYLFVPGGIRLAGRMAKKV